MQAEFHPERVHIIGKRAQSAREFLRVFIPFADTASPTEIHNEQLEPKACRGIGVLAEGLLVQSFSVSPGVPRHIGEPRGSGCGERAFGEELRAVARFVPVTLKKTDEGSGDLECLPRTDRMVELGDGGGKL